MTNLELIESALRLIGVLAVGQPVAIEDAQLALQVAQDLHDEWADEGIAPNWPPHAALDDVCPFVGTEKAAMQYNLALRLCPHFERNPSEAVVALAGSTLSRLTRNAVALATNPVTLALPAPSAGTCGGRFEDG